MVCLRGESHASKGSNEILNQITGVAAAAGCLVAFAFRTYQHQLNQCDVQPIHLVIQIADPPMVHGPAERKFVGSQTIRESSYSNRSYRRVQRIH